MFYVYEWYNAKTGYVFYVGKGKGNRCREKNDRNPMFKNYVRKHVCEVRKSYIGLTETQAYEKEIEVISFYRKTGQAKCNILDGGDNPPTFFGVDHPNSRKIIQLTLHGEYVKEWNCIMDIERAFNVQNSLITRICKAKRGSAKGYLWVYKDEYNGNEKYVHNPSTVAKKILQYDLNGIFIREWNSAMDVNKELGYLRPSISGCCKGTYKTCHGYVWKYKENEVIQGKIEVDTSEWNRVPSRIIQLDSKGSLIAIHGNGADAAKAIGRKYNSGIIKCCNGKARTAYKFKWVYEHVYKKNAS